MLPFYDPDHMGREIESAREYRERFIKLSEGIAREQCGRHYLSAGKGEDVVQAQPENSLFAYAAFMLPETSYSAPSPRVTAKRPGLHADVAEAMESALRHWASPQGSDFLEQWELCEWDSFSGVSIMRVGVEPMNNGSGVADISVYAEWVPRWNFLIDPRANSSKKFRWCGHEYERDLDDLQNAGWADPEALESLAKSYPGEGEGGPSDKHGEWNKGKTPDRNIVRLVDIFVIEQKVILTMAMPPSGTPVMLRPPRPFWGPDNGPYVIHTKYKIPGSAYGMGPLQSIYDAYEELNAHLRAAGEEAATAKTVTFVDASAPEVLTAITDGKSGDVYPVKDLKDKIQVVQTGVVTAGRLEYAQTTRERLDRVVGFSDAQRGRATGGTATESQIVQANADLRTEWLRKKSLESVGEVLQKVAWYLFNDPNVVMDLTVPDPFTGGDVGATFMGGPQPGQEELEWADFNLDIDPQSMQRQDDGVVQQRWLQLIQLTPVLYQMLTAMPGVNVRWLIDQYGASINQPKLSELLFRDLLMMGPMMPGMMPPQQSGMTPPQLGMMEQGVPPQGGKPQGAAPFGTGDMNPMSAGGTMPGGPTPIQRNPRMFGGKQPAFAA